MQVAGTLPALSERVIYHLGVLIPAKLLKEMEPYWQCHMLLAYRFLEVVWSPMLEVLADVHTDHAADSMRLLQVLLCTTFQGGLHAPKMYPPQRETRCPRTPVHEDEEMNLKGLLSILRHGEDI